MPEIVVKPNATTEIIVAPIFYEFSSFFISDVEGKLKGYVWVPNATDTKSCIENLLEYNDEELPLTQMMNEKTVKLDQSFHEFFRKSPQNPTIYGLCTDVNAVIENESAKVQRHSQTLQYLPGYSLSVSKGCSKRQLVDYLSSETLDGKSLKDYESSHVIQSLSDIDTELHAVGKILSSNCDDTWFDYVYPENNGSWTADCRPSGIWQMETTDLECSVGCLATVDQTTINMTSSDCYVGKQLKLNENCTFACRSGFHVFPGENNGICKMYPKVYSPKYSFQCIQNEGSDMQSSVFYISSAIMAVCCLTVILTSLFVLLKRRRRGGYTSI